MELVLVLLLVAAAAYFLSAPLRGGGTYAREDAKNVEQAEWAAARDAKYREIRDVELDYRTGKLSHTDWKAQDRVLRAEAIEILRKLDALEGRADEPSIS